MRFRALAIPLVAPLLAVGLTHCVGEEPAFPEIDASAAAIDGASDAPASPVDANDEATVGDASVDASPCNLAVGFAAPVNVAELNGPFDDESARLTPEALTLYFSRRAGPKPDEGGLTVLSATRGALDAPFGAITPLSLGVDPSGPSISADRSTLYFSIGGSADAGPDILAATLPFTVATSKPQTKLNSAAWDYTPYIRPDNLEIYFTSRRLGTTDDIFVAPRVNGDFDTPVPVAAINTTTANERAPVITANGKTLFYASDKGGNFEIYYSNRASVTQPFTAGVLVSELSGTSQDLPDWISPDGCTLYFRSDRAGGKGGKDIWRATRP